VGFGQPLVKSFVMGLELLLSLTLGDLGLRGLPVSGERL